MNGKLTYFTSPPIVDEDEDPVEANSAEVDQPSEDPFILSSSESESQEDL